MAQSSAIRSVQPVVGPDRPQFAAVQADGYQAELDALKERRQEKVDIAEKTIGPKSEQYIRFRQSYDDAIRDFETARIKVQNRPLKKSEIPGWLFVSLGLGLGALETPVNKFIFDVIFKQASFVSWIVALCVGFLIFIVAHYDGVNLRHIWSESNRRIYWGKFLWFLFITGFLLGLVSAFSIARWRYSLSGNSADIGSLVSDFTAAQSVGSLFAALKTALTDSSSQVLAGVNLAGILAAMILAARTHDPDDNYDASAANKNRSDKKLSKLDRKYQAALEEIDAEFEPKMTRLNENIASAKQRMSPPPSGE